MSKVLYFSGETELAGIHGLDNAKFAAMFPDVKGRRYDSFSRMVGWPPGVSLRLENILPVERVINYKSSPSKHACDARCMHAKGRIMNCECSCGGKNHGRGSFSCN